MQPGDGDVEVVLVVAAHVVEVHGVGEAAHVVAVPEGLVAGLEVVPVGDALAAVGLHDVEDVAAVHVVDFGGGGGVALQVGDDGGGEGGGDGVEWDGGLWWGR